MKKCALFRMLTLALVVIFSAATIAPAWASPVPGVSDEAWEFCATELYESRRTTEPQLRQGVRGIQERLGEVGMKRLAGVLNAAYDDQTNYGPLILEGMLEQAKSLDALDATSLSTNWAFYENYVPGYNTPENRAKRAEATRQAQREAVEAGMELFVACYKVNFPKADAPLTVEEMRKLHGDTAADQYAGIISRFCDTGDANDMSEGYRLLNDFYWEHLSENTKTPLGDFGKKYVEYIPGSASSKVTVTEQPFPDVPVDAWYAEAVTAMKDSGIIKGCDDGLFHPERTVTKGEFYALLLRAGSRDGDNIGGGNSGGSHWATAVVKTANYCGFWPCETGHENDSTERIEAATRIAMLHRNGMKKKDFAATWKWVTEKERKGMEEWTFEEIPDHATIQAYIDNPPYYGTRENEVLYAYNNGIIKGTEEAGSFNPYGTLTRAEVAQMFYNAHMTKRTGIIPKKAASFGGGSGLLYDFESTESFIP